MDKLKLIELVMSTLYNNAPNKPRTAIVRGGLLFVLFLLLGIGVGYGQTVSIAGTSAGSENGGGAVTDGVFTVTQTSPSASDTEVSYTVGGTATSGADYTALSGTVTITAGLTSADITVPVLEDFVVEGDETVEVTLTSVTSGSATLDPAPANLTASITINDDDTATVSIAGTSAGSENGGGAVTDGVFTVT
ncbi:Calx-beta domain-containing protein, partial [Flagellimonas halotolerans]